MSVTFLPTFNHAEETPKIAATQNRHSQKARIIQFSNDRLTLNIEDISLTELLEEIARQSGLSVMSYKSLEEKVTIQIHQIPLDAGLRRILRQHNFVVGYSQQLGGNKSAVRRPRKLWIFPGGKKQNSINTMPLDYVGQDLSDNDLGSLAEIRTDNSVESLILALSKEKSEEVRQEIILDLGWLGDKRAIEPLAQILRKDQNPEVRESAIIALIQIGGDGVIDPLIYAKSDHDSTVRDLAIIALAEVGVLQESEALVQIESDKVTDPIKTTNTGKGFNVRRLTLP